MHYGVHGGLGALDGACLVSHLEENFALNLKRGGHHIWLYMYMYGVLLGTYVLMAACYCCCEDLEDRAGIVRMLEDDLAGMAMLEDELRERRYFVYRVPLACSFEDQM